MAGRGKPQRAIVPRHGQDGRMNIGTRLFTKWRGREVGRDRFGNIYYEERTPRPGMRRRRWVIYARAVDASEVPPEWHAWLHYTTDAPLPEDRRYPWQQEHQPNLTGTPAAWRPPGHDLEGGRRARATGDYEAWSPDQDEARDAARDAAIPTPADAAQR